MEIVRQAFHPEMNPLINQTVDGSGKYCTGIGVFFALLLINFTAYKNMFLDDMGQIVPVKKTYERSVLAVLVDQSFTEMFGNIVCVMFGKVFPPVVCTGNQIICQDLLHGAVIPIIRNPADTCTGAKLGKRNSVLLGLGIRVAGGILMAVTMTKATLMIGGMMAGVGYGIAGCAFASVIQDALTYGEWKNGFSMIGMGNAANSFCNKVGNSLGTVLLGAIMSATGYVAGLATQPASAIFGFKAIYVYIPVVLEFVAIFAVTQYDLDKHYALIARDLAEGRYAPGVEAYANKENH